MDCQSSYMRSIGDDPWPAQALHVDQLSTGEQYSVCDVARLFLSVHDRVNGPWRFGALVRSGSLAYSGLSARNNQQAMRTGDSRDVTSAAGRPYTLLESMCPPGFAPHQSE